MAAMRTLGQEVRQANVTAVSALSNILKSSLGPQGLDKMLVDDVGEVTITNDGATILQKIEVEHPAAKMLVELADLQDKEVGDGTTSVVLIAAELLKRAHELANGGVHPTSVMAGYRVAMKQSIKFIQKELSMPVDSLGEDTLLQVARTAMSSKVTGMDIEFFSKMVVDALQAVKVERGGKTKFPVSEISIVKTHGKSATESMLVSNGYTMMISRASQAMPTRVSPAKIALVDFNLNKYHLGLNVTLRITDPKEVEKVRMREMDIIKEKVQKILNAGANVVMTTKAIDDIALKYFVEAGAMGIRRVDKKDMKRIAKATGATVILSLANADGEEEFDPAHLGEAEEVYEQRVGDDDHLFVKGCKNSRAATILLRGANSFMLDELDRSLHDSLCAVSRTMESSAVVPGGGAVEAALSIYLSEFARTLSSREQLAIAQFADALLVIPKTLASNAALDTLDLVAKLRVHHNTAQTAGDEAKKKEYRHSGLDLLNGKVHNAAAAGVLEPLVSKLKCLKFATEAAISILRIDDLIKVTPPPEEDQMGGMGM